MKGFLKVCAFIVLAIVLGAWAGGIVMLPTAQVQPQYAGTIFSKEADTVLRVSCFDCHSNEAHYLWFDYLPVAASLVAQDVIKGRKELNFSLWDQYPQARKDKKLKEMREQVEGGEMPPWYYTVVHRDSALSSHAKQVLLAALPAAGPAAGEQAEASESKKTRK